MNTGYHNKGRLEAKKRKADMRMIKMLTWEMIIAINSVSILLLAIAVICILVE